jgi:hypothetical protein
MRLFALLLLWILQAALILLLVNADWIERQANYERSSIAEQLGGPQSAQLEARSRVIYDKWFTLTGIRDQTYARLLPDETRRKDGLENLAPWFFTWLRHRLDSFWLLVFQAIHRLQLLREWGGLSLIAAAAATVDGIVQRRIKRSHHELASADKYVIARHALLVVTILPLLYLSAPIAVSPWAVPAWGACVALTCMSLAAHAQHRI